jgi:hypothetical protein
MRAATLPAEEALAAAPVGCPTPAQRAAVTAAEARARALLPGLELPTWRWVHRPDSQSRAVVRFPAFGPVVWLCDDLAPAQVYATALHELGHVRDQDVLSSLSVAERERRAEDFTGYALGGATTMDSFEDQCRQVSALCAEGMSRTAAWAKVGRRGPLGPLGARTGPAAAPVNGLTPLPRCACGGVMLLFLPGGTYRACNRCGRGSSRS